MVFDQIIRFLGIPIGSEEDALRAVQKGLPVSAFRRADRPVDFPANLIGSATSMRRRLARYLKDADPVSPLELAATDSGARLMETRLRRTAYGMA